MQQGGVRIGHYILGKTIGDGGFGKVKEAVHQLTGVKVAVKILNKRKMKTKKMNSKTKREIRFLRYFNHPNIIRLYQVLNNNNDIFVIMELASKGQLYDLIQKYVKMDEKTGRHYFKQILSGVQYCHQNLVAHRDLKPENILVDQNDTLKIVDFGLSNLMKDGKFLKTSCGSPNYASPQIVRGRIYQGTLIDVWSCGVILYAMLAGCLPFDEQHQVVLYKKIESANYVMPDFLSVEAKDLIHRMLQVDPSRRITIYEIKNHPWIRQKIPLYANVSTACSTKQQSGFKINLEVLNTVKKFNLDFHGHTTQQSILKAIKKKQDVSFVIAYQLLSDQMDKNRVNQHNSCIQKARIFDEVTNKLETDTYTQQKVWQNGKIYKIPAKILAKNAILVLTSMKTSYEIKSADYKIKCTYIPRRLITTNSFVGLDAHDYDQPTLQERLNDDNPSQSKLPKYTRKELSFTLQIYQLKPEHHVLDIQLSRGHSFIFMEYIREFLERLDSQIDRI